MVSASENELDRLHGLNRTHDSGQNTEHSAFGAGRHEPRRRRFGIEAAVAWAIGHAKNGNLTLKTKDGAVDVGLAEKDASIVDEIPRGEIIRAIHDDVEVLEQFERIRAGQLRFDRFDLDVRIEIREARAGSFSLGLAHVAGAKRNLALKIREIHNIEINQTELADARGRKIQAQRRTEPSRADEQYLGVFQLELPVHPDFRHDEMAAVAQNLLFGKTHSGLCAGLRLSACGHCDFLSF